MKGLIVKTHQKKEPTKKRKSTATQPDETVGDGSQSLSKFIFLGETKCHRVKNDLSGYSAAFLRMIVKSSHSHGYSYGPPQTNNSNKKKATTIASVGICAKLVARLPGAIKFS